MIDYSKIIIGDRRLRLLAGALVVQIILGLIVFWPTSSVLKDQTFFSDKEIQDISYISISDDEGNQLKLNRNESDWVLSDTDGFFVSDDKVSPLLQKLVNLNSNRMVAQTESSHLKLEVGLDNYKRKIEILWANQEKNTILLGNSAGSGATHFRLMSNDEVYLTGGLTAWDANTTASRYIDTEYFMLDKDSISYVQLKNDNGIFHFSRNNDSLIYDDIEDSEFRNQSAVNTLLTQISSIRMASPIGKVLENGVGIEDPKVVLIVRSESDNGVIESMFKVGEKRGDNYLASSSMSEYFALVSSYTANNLLDVVHSNFVEDN